MGDADKGLLSHMLLLGTYPPSEESPWTGKEGGAAREGEGDFSSHFRLQIGANNKEGWGGGRRCQGEPDFHVA